MPPEDIARIKHMLESARWVQNWTVPRQRKDLDLDRLFQSALLHEIQIIGEAAFKLSSETQHSIPQIPWSKIAAMRHIIVHDYMGVDFDIIWDVAANRIPELIKELARVLKAS